MGSEYWKKSTVRTGVAYKREERKEEEKKRIQERRERAKGRLKNNRKRIVGKRKEKKIGTQNRKCH